MKEILVTISGATESAVSEKLRMTVGLTLDDNNKISVLFIDDGVFIGLGVDRPETGIDLDKHLHMLELMELPLLADAESCAKRGVSFGKYKIAMADKAKVAELFRESAIII